MVQGVRSPSRSSLEAAIVVNLNGCLLLIADSPTLHLLPNTPKRDNRSFVVEHPFDIRGEEHEGTIFTSLAGVSFLAPLAAEFSGIPMNPFRKVRADRVAPRTPQVLWLRCGDPSGKGDAEKRESGTEEASAVHVGLPVVWFVKFQLGITTEGFACDGDVHRKRREGLRSLRCDM